jgi:hypothetical protein
MKTLTVRTTIASDGTIDLHIPSDLPPGEAEVVLVIQHSASPTPIHRGPPYPSDHAVWKGKLPDVDIDADLKEMNALWEKSLDLPE